MAFKSARCKNQGEVPAGYPLLQGRKDFQARSVFKREQIALESLQTGLDGPLVKETGESRQRMYCSSPAGINHDHG